MANVLEPAQGEPRPGWWPAFFLLPAVEAFAGLFWLLFIASDPKNRLLFGLSAARLSLALLLAGAGCMFLLLAWRSTRSPKWRARWLNASRLAEAGRWLLPAALAGLWVIPAGLVGLRAAAGGAYLTLYQRLLPLLVYGMLLCLQVVLAAVRLRPPRLARPTLLAGGAALAALLLLWLLTAASGLGLTPDDLSDGWGTPGVPILEGQLWLALGGTLLGTALFAVLQPGQARMGPARKRGLLKTDWLAAALIWCAAGLLWNAQPVRESYFLVEPRPPTAAYYPHSDAATSGLVARSILLGNGYNNGEITTRPFYVLILAGLHAVSGGQYLDVIALQTWLLAFFPVVLYFLGLLLHSRAAGWLAACLAVLREVNAVAGSPFSGVSNSKLFMSDLPAALGVSLVVLIGVLWLENPQRRRLLPLLAGGVLGLLALVRLQVLLLAPFLALAGWAGNRRGALKALLLFGIGILLAVGPWLARSWAITGLVVFDEPVESHLMASMYTTAGERAAYPRLEGENDGQYSRRLMGEVRSFVWQNPGYTARFISGHFLNNLVDTLLVLPVRRDLPQSLSEFFRLQNSFWLLWDGRVSLAGAAQLLAALVVIALGLGSAWVKARWAVLLPVFALLGYSLSNAVARQSGWRYILPADWVGYFFFCLGSAQLIYWLVGVIFPRQDGDEKAVQPGAARAFSTRRTVLLGLAVLLVGASLPLVEHIIPRRYQPASQPVLVDELLALDVFEPAGADADRLRAFAAQPGAVIRRGLAFYPRFYQGGEGEPGGGWPAFRRRAYPRLSFALIGAEMDFAALPLAEAPAVFADGSPVYVVGCREDAWVDAFLVAGQARTFWRDPEAGPLICGGNP